jgi:transposase-like protein
MTKHYPQEFRDDVLKFARLSQISIRQVALDFGISAATLYQWLAKAEMKQQVLSTGKRNRTLRIPFIN